MADSFLTQDLKLVINGKYIFIFFIFYNEILEISFIDLFIDLFFMARSGYSAPGTSSL